MQRLPHPQASASLLSRLTFYWMLEIFREGNIKDFTEDDLFEPLDEHRSDILGERLEQLWYEEVKFANKRKRKPNLINVLKKAFGTTILLYGVELFIMEVLINIVQPLILGQLILYFTSAGSQVSQKMAYVYAGVLVLCSAIKVCIMHPYLMITYHMGMKLRVGLCSLIYRKLSKLNYAVLGAVSPGYIMNIMSHDVAKFDTAVAMLHYLWIGPLETICIITCIWAETGIVALVGVACFAIFIPLQGILGRLSAKYRNEISPKTDDRIKLMNDVISGIEIIKMFTWEDVFGKQVEYLRRQETQTLRKIAYIKGTMLSFALFATRMCIFISCVLNAVLDFPLTAKNVYIITSYYQILRQTIHIFFPQAVYKTAGIVSCLRKITSLLNLEETQKLNYSHIERIHIEKDFDHQTYVSDEIVVKMDNVTAKWSLSEEEYALKNVSIDVSYGQLIAVIGPVGSGKSSLLHALLGELRVTQGSITVKGRISYAAQEAWLFSGTIRDNILFGQPLVRGRYNQVVQACALIRDFIQLPYGDETMVGDHGINLSGGQRSRISLARAVYRNADIYLFDNPLTEVDVIAAKRLFNDCICGFLGNKTIIYATNELQFLPESDTIVIMKYGSVADQGSFHKLRHEKHIDFTELLEEISIAEEQSVLDIRLSRKTAISAIPDTVHEIIHVPEGRSKGRVNKELYNTYFRAGGNYFVLAIVGILFILTQFLGSGCDYWIAQWTNAEEIIWSKKRNITIDATEPAVFSDRSTCLKIYAVLVIATILITIARSIAFYTVCIDASVKLHRAMLTSVTHAIIPFFQINHVGRILNRFIKDIRCTDEELPQAILDSLQVTLILIGNSVMIIIVRFSLIMPILLLMVVGFILLAFYINTSRNIKRLDAVTRSPVVQHLTATLQGLVTIRAFGAQKNYIKEYDLRQDLHSSAWYLYIVTNRAFGFYLDLMCLLFIFFVTNNFLIIKDENLGGDIGLAITQAILMAGILQWGIRQWTEVEHQMISVERINDFINIEKERTFVSDPELQPPDTWPKNGEIEIINLYARYTLEAAPILQNINILIKAKEKIGIVGRAGAGKSTLIRALFRLTYIRGRIYIDGLNIANMGLYDLRKKMSIIPQEPVIFSDTLRKNLDPFGEYPDSALWDALEQVEMKNAVTDLEPGLEMKLYTGGINFSVGQRQLICLARAILHKNRILIMDEAISGVDPKTEEIIHSTLSRNFAGCTVINVTHRVQTVVNYDKILVLDAGRVKEFDHPYLLLKNKQGYFYRMAKESGLNMKKFFLKKTRESYNAKMKQKNMHLEEH